MWMSERQYESERLRRARMILKVADFHDDCEQDGGNKSYPTGGRCHRSQLTGAEKPASRVSQFGHQRSTGLV